MLIILTSLLIAATTQIDSKNVSFTQTGTGAVKRGGDDKYKDFNSVKDFGATGDGATNDAAAFAAAIAAKVGTIYVPASATCYNLGGTTVSLSAGRTLRGAGMGGAAQGPTCIKYTGAGCGLLIDSVSFAGIQDLEVQVDSTNANARGICIKSTSGVAEFNAVERVSIRMVNATRRTPGQIALLMQDPSGNAVFWNTIRTIRTAYWDTSFLLDGNPGNGVNANHFYDLMSWGHVTGFRLIGHSDDNRFYGLHCSRSDNTGVPWTSSCVVLGDDGSAVIDNQIEFTADAAGGTGSVCATIGVASGANTLLASCEAGGPVTDGYTGTLKNVIYEPVSGKTTTNTLLPSKLGYPPTSGAFGLQVQSSRVIEANKTVAPVDMVDAPLSATTSQLLDSSIFTCTPTANRNLTIPRADGATGVVQNLPNQPVIVGAHFKFVVAVNHASNTVTLIAGTNVTIYGIATVTNGSRTVWCRVTNIGVGTEAYTCY